MRPKKGMDAASIIEKLEERKRTMTKFLEINLRDGTEDGYMASMHELSCINSILAEVAQ